MDEKLCVKPCGEGEGGGKDITHGGLECRETSTDQDKVSQKSTSENVDNNLFFTKQSHELFEPPSKKQKSQCVLETENSALHGEDDYDHVQSGLVYVTSSFPGMGAMQDAFVDCIQGCECVGLCHNDCGCVIQYGCPYENERLKEQFCKRPVVECNDLCRCGVRCPSRVVQRGPVIGLRVLPLPDKGYGVVTSRFIPKGSFVCEYAGEYISSQEASLRFSKQTDEDSNYILVLREHSEAASGPIITIIDPTIVGNIGRYVNHSCDPNMVVVPVRINFMTPLAALFATRDILPGEELCYDYSHTIASGDLSPHDDGRPMGGQLSMLYYQQTSEMAASSSISKHNVNDREDVYSSAGISSSTPSGCEMSGILYSTERAVASKQVSSGSRKPCLCKAANCRKFLPVDKEIL